jgi:predicted ribosome quality control (RQC) complex YloA/Tae2 family protein
VSLRVSELLPILAELQAGLVGAIVQKVYAPDPWHVYLEVRKPGQSALLVLCSKEVGGRIAVALERPVSPPRASAFQQRLRALIVGARIGEVSAPLGLGAGVRLDKEEEPSRWLTVDWRPGRAHLALLEVGSLDVLAASPPQTRSVERVPAPLPATSDEPRFGPVPDVPFGWAQAAQAQLAQHEVIHRAEDVRKQRLTALKAQRTRLQRTRLKVEAEAARGPAALEHQRLGDLMTQNMHLLTRGKKQVQLTEYTEEGTRTVDVTLDPKRSPREEVEWHFHQYRRLSRGIGLARARLEVLEAELAALESALAEVGSASTYALSESAPKTPGPRRTGPEPASLYREVQGAGGGTLLIGRHGRGNDEVTFRLARPHDLWVHVRGLPGSHVIVRLERGAALPQELLLDAAHLAIHYSAARDEDRVEVQYAPAKFVRKRKGGEPGQVLVTQEKTFVVRKEPARMLRLLQQVETRK